MKKKIFLLILLIVLLIALGFLSFVFFSNMKEKQKDEYINEFTTMGETLYSDYYYKVLSIDKPGEELTKFLKKFDVIGLKFDLNSIQTYSKDYNQKVEEFIKKYDNCKKEDVVVTIFPKSPYGNTDFNSKIQIDCKTK